MLDVLLRFLEMLLKHDRAWSLESLDDRLR